MKEISNSSIAHKRYYIYIYKKKKLFDPKYIWTIPRRSLICLCILLLGKKKTSNNKKTPAPCVTVVKLPSIRMIVWLKMDVMFSVWPIMMLLVQLLFQSVMCPSVPFSCYPQSCPFWSFVFGWPLFLGKGPLFLWTGCSFRDMLDWEELLAAAGGCCLGKGPNCLTCQAGNSKGLSHLVSASLPPSLWWVDGGLSKAFQAHLPRMLLWPAWEPSTPRPPGTHPINKDGLLVVTHWRWNT